MAQLTHSPHPLSPSRDREVLVVPIIGNPTIAEVLTGNKIDFENRPTVVQLNGEVIPRSGYGIRTVRDDDLITVRAGVAGGKGGSEILELVVLIVVTILTYGAGSSLAAGMGASVGIGATASNMIVMIAGTLIVAGISAIAASQGSIRGGSTGAGAAAPQYALNGVSNNPRAMQPIPVVLGTITMFPDVGAAPYADYEGSDQFLYAMYNFGLGDLTISNLQIGTTALTSFTGVTQQFSDSDGNITLFPGDVQSQTGADLTYNTPVVRTTEVGTTQIGIDVTGTLYSVTNSGSYTTASCIIDVEYRLHGTSTWSNLMTTDPTDAAQSQYAQWQSMQAYAGLYAYGEYGAPTYYANTYYSPDYYNSLQLSNDSSNPVRSTVVRQVPAGQYDVQLTLQTPAPTSSSSGQDITWTYLKSYLPDTANYKGQTRLALKIQASGQLNGAVANLSATVSNQIPTNPSYDGVTWVTQATSNPAWQFLYVCRGLFNDAGQCIFGAGLADSRIDIAGLIEWAQFCDEGDWTCNLVLNSTMVVADVLNMIAQCGQGQLDYSKGIVGAIWDEGGLTPVQMFGMANIKAGSFQVSYISANLADQFTVNFNNAALGYKPDSVSALLPGVTLPKNPTQLDFLGITNVDQAGRQANLLTASQYYRNRLVQFEADIEGLVASRGDAVTLSHDLTSWSYSGRLQPGSNTTTLVLDREITFVAASQPYIMVRYPNGTFQTCRVQESTGTTNTLTLLDDLTSSPDADAATTGGNKQMDYLYFFDPAATPGKRMKVLSKQYMGNDANWVQVICTDDPDAYYAAVGGTYTYVTPSLLNQIAPTVSNVVITEQLQSSTADHVTVFVNWTATNAIATHVRYLLGGSTTWVDAGSVYTNNFSVDVYEATTITVQLTPVALAQTTTGGNPSVVTTYTITGLNAPTEDLAPQMPNVSGLQLQLGTTNGGNANEFAGQDAKLIWNNVAASAPDIGSEPSGGDSGGVDPYFSYYRVTILNADGSTRRTEAAYTNAYVYTYEKNVEDGAGVPVRSFTISIVAEGSSNQISPIPATLTVTNPPPDVPTGITLTPNFNWIGISWNTPSDTDYAGMLIYASASSSFSPGPGNLVATVSQGNTAQIQTLGSTDSNAPIAPATEYYLYFQPYDVFGQTGLNTSSQFNTTTVQITTIDLGPGSVTATALAAAAVTTAALAAGCVTNVAIAALAVSTSQIQVGAITNTLIATGAVTGSSIAAGTITAVNITAGTITGSLIQAGTITSSLIQAGTIVAANIAAGTITGTLIAATTIDATHIVSGTITTTQIAASTITGGNIAANTISGGNIVAGTITASLISVSTLSALSANLGSITAGDIYGAVVRSGAFTTWAWPSSGTGFYLSSNGLLLGNYNTGQYVQINSDGSMYMPGMSCVGGTLTVTQLNVINTSNVTNNAITTSVAVSSTATTGAFEYLTITSAMLPSGASTVPVMITGTVIDAGYLDICVLPGTIDMGATTSTTYTVAYYVPIYTYPYPYPTGVAGPYYYTVTTTTSAWTTPGNITSSALYSTLVGDTITVEQQLAPGSYTLAAYDHGGTTGWRAAQTYAGISVNVLQR